MEVCVSVIGIFILALLVTVLLITVVWMWAVKVDNFSLIDPAWAASFAVHAAVYISLSEGDLWRRLLLGGMLSLWSLRLSYYLTVRTYGHHPEEDTRYKELRTSYGAKFRFRFFVFFMYQAISVSVLSLPFLIVFQNAAPSPRVIELIGLVWFVISLGGESLADYQMKKFKADPANRGKVCDQGLWRFSRHPNYFFEFSIWVGFFVFMMGTQGMIWALYAPLVILLLLLKVTGVPPSEQQALKSRGDAYREYQRKTSVFVPWFVKD